MGQDTLVYAESIVSRGSISTDNGKISSDGALGNLSVTNLTPTGIVSLAQQTGTVTTLVNSATITAGASGGNGVVRVTAAGAVTSIIIAAGTKAGQILTVVHEGAAANTLTMAAAGTSNVAAGVTCVLSGLAAHIFVWDAVTALWYQTGPAAN